MFGDGVRLLWKVGDVSVVEVIDSNTIDVINELSFAVKVVRCFHIRSKYCIERMKKVTVQNRWYNVQAGCWIEWMTESRTTSTQYPFPSPNLISTSSIYNSRIVLALFHQTMDVSKDS